MKPLNQQERLRTFLLFTALFLIGIAIVSIPFFSMYQLNKKEHEIVRQESQELKMKMNEMQNQETLQRSFVDDMNKIKNEIDKMEIPENDINVVMAFVGEYIKDAIKYTHIDSTWRTPMYDNILETYSELKEDKYAKITARNRTDDKIDEVKRELRKCKGNLKYCERKLAATQSKPLINPKKK